MKIAVIYMASGFSRRYGSNKLLTEFQGKKLYQYGLDLITQLILELDADIAMEGIVVSQYNEILEYAKQAGLKAIENDHSEEGISASIKLGMKAASIDCMHYMFFVADQPLLNLSTVIGFIHGYLKSNQRLGCVSDGVVTGNPTIFSKDFEVELLNLHGDQGGKRLLLRNEDDLFVWNAPSLELADIDMQTELKNLEKSIRS